ncbi:hypothetical protein LINPERPRIM_LOCUS37063 [Linum perenne]
MDLQRRERTEVWAADLRSRLAAMRMRKRGKERERESKKNVQRNVAASRLSRRQTQRPLLHRILIVADLELKYAVQTSILSRRWLSIWKSSLTKLVFNIPQSNDDEWKSFIHSSKTSCRFTT